MLSEETVLWEQIFVGLVMRTPLGDPRGRHMNSQETGYMLNRAEDLANLAVKRILSNRHGKKEP